MSVTYKLWCESISQVRVVQTEVVLKAMRPLKERSHTRQIYGCRCSAGLAYTQIHKPLLTCKGALIRVSLRSSAASLPLRLVYTTTDCNEQRNNVWISLTQVGFTLRLFTSSQFFSCSNFLCEFLHLLWQNSPQ